MLRCPRCGFTDKFYVSATANVDVDGNTEYVENHDGFLWDDESACCCSHCFLESTVKEFHSPQTAKQNL